MSLVNIPVAPYTEEQLIFTNGAVTGLSTDLYQPSTGVGRGQHAVRVFMHLESDAGDPSIRFKVNGSSPAGACGMLWTVGDYLTLDGWESVQNFGGICSAAGEECTAVVFYYF